MNSAIEEGVPDRFQVPCTRRSFQVPHVSSQSTHMMSSPILLTTWICQVPHASSQITHMTNSRVLLTRGSFRFFINAEVSDLSHEDHGELSDSLHKELPKFSSEGLSDVKTSNEGVSDISHEEALSDFVNTSSQISSHEKLADSQIPHVRSFQAGDHGEVRQLSKFAHDLS